MLKTVARSIISYSFAGVLFEITIIIWCCDASLGDSAWKVNVSALEEETCTLFRNVRHQSPSDAAPHLKRTETVIWCHTIKCTLTKEITVVWNATPYILAEIYRRFGEAYFRIDDCSVLKMEATCSSETSVVFYQTTRHHISEWDIFQSLPWEPHMLQLTCDLRLSQFWCWKLQSSEMRRSFNDW